MSDGGLRDACSRGGLEALAGAASYERGEEYALDGRVQRLAVGADSATATVAGSSPYEIALRVDPAGGLRGSCTCPLGESGLAVCEQARPDPVALAERLFELETSTDDLFAGALGTYAEVLGAAGCARYAELAHAAWATGTSSWTLARIMERLADGDVDRVVEIKARTVEHSWDYLEIARLLRDAGRREDAIGWAERGVAAHPDAQLRDFLADSLAPARGEEAHAGGCSRDLWRALARERAPQRPADAVYVYHRLLADTIDLRNDAGYDGAIELLTELHGLLAPHGHEAAHLALVTELRDVHRRKRNLIKRLDAQRWPAPCP